MQIFHGLPKRGRLPWQGCAATVGNFDGVHLGHRQLFSRLQQVASARQLPTLAIIFEPYPEEFWGQGGVARLMGLHEKVAVLKSLGVNYLWILPFNRKFAAVSAHQFADEVLGQMGQVRALVVGDDFVFGHDRVGDFALLRHLAERRDWWVEQLPTFKVGEIRVSSTRIRRAIENADFPEAVQLLGHPYWVSGKVVVGDRLGRNLGFPTANIYWGRYRLPVRGVYAVLVHGIAAEPLAGLANLGCRPTVNNGNPTARWTFEVYLLNFNEDLYGRRLDVEFIDKLRNEKRFDSLDELRDQIEQDVVIAQNVFLQQNARTMLYSLQS